MTCDDCVEKKKDFEDCRDANTRGNVHGVNCANDDTNRGLKVIVAISIKPRKQNRKKKTQDTYLVSSLDHSLLALHLDVLLLLGVGQGEWHTEQESTGADNPKGLAAE